MLANSERKKSLEKTTRIFARGAAFHGSIRRTLTAHSEAEQAERYRVNFPCAARRGCGSARRACARIQ